MDSGGGYPVDPAQQQLQVPGAAVAPATTVPPPVVVPPPPVVVVSAASGKPPAPAPPVMMAPAPPPPPVVPVHHPAMGPHLVQDQARYSNPPGHRWMSQTTSAATVSEGLDICAYILTTISILIIIATFPVSLIFCIKVVQEYERAVIFRLGRLLRGGAKGPGIFFIIPCIDTYCKVDLRTVSFDVPPQEGQADAFRSEATPAYLSAYVPSKTKPPPPLAEDVFYGTPPLKYTYAWILSKDSVTVAVDAVVYYRISNATIAVSNVEDYGHSTRLLAATTLRNVLGTKNLSEILSERESISHVMQASLDEATDPWGVKVERVEIKDVRLPVQLQRAMAAEAEAAREARAKVIAAEGEQRASRSLKEAAEVIADTPSALQLRYLQTLASIAAEKNSTIVFPIPMELFSGFISSASSHGSGGGGGGGDVKKDVEASA
ncbi:band 7 protein AGAP004871-like isoform X1 [Dermacentor albipictus]|uniref:band 7 protein AGAP004871-like isoform X1 n=1 Tax=Dermacentor albipictus TaxID=60249 RepID=UPI0031FD27A9